MLFKANLNKVEVVYVSVGHMVYQDDFRYLNSNADANSIHKDQTALDVPIGTVHGMEYIL